MKKILVIGSFMTDLVVQSDRFCQEGETIIGNGFYQFTGGKGANQAIAAALLGAKVEMIGKLGKDSFGKEHIKSLENNHISHEYILFSDEKMTGIGNPQLDSKGHNRIVVVPGANMEFMPAELERLRERIKEADIIVLQLEIPMETVYTAIDLAYNYGKVIIFNPAPAAKLNPSYASKINYIIPNEHEAELITGISTIDMKGVSQAANNLINQGYKNVVITLGDKGSYFRNNTFEKFIPSFRVSPKDTTAAGDSFIGAFAYGLSKNNDILSILNYASAASALTVTRLGAQASLPNKSEVDEFIDSYGIQLC